MSNACIILKKTGPADRFAARGRVVVVDWCGVPGDMVVTRKRSCSASEPGTTTCGTPRTAKLKKQDDNHASPVTRASSRCMTASGTPTTPKRTRRVTDSVVDAAPPSPCLPRTTRSRKNSDVQNNRTLEKETPEEGNCYRADDIRGLKELTVKLSHVSTPSTPVRSRRVSGGKGDGLGSSGVDTVATTTSLDSADVTLSTTKVSTPLRRSRRLSGGIEESPSQGTPRQLSFSIARIIGSEGKKTREDDSKQSNLPIIEEDTEQTETLDSPKRNAKVAAAEEEKIIAKKSGAVLQSESDDKVENLNSSGETKIDAESVIPDVLVPAEEKEVISPAPLIKVDNKGKQGEQTKDSSKCDGNYKTQSSTEDVEIAEKVINVVIKNSNGDEQQKTSNNNVENDCKFKINSSEEENNAITTSNFMEVTDSPIKPSIPKDKLKTAPSNKVIKESSATQVTHGAHENGNNNISCIDSTLQQVMAGDKKLLKVIPELEKKIGQIKSIPKGQPISGRWWKKEKQR